MYRTGMTDTPSGDAPMNRPPDEPRGAFHAEADDTAYPDVGALVTGARRSVVASRRRRLTALGAATAAAVVVGVLVATQSTHLAAQQPSGRGATTPAASPTGCGWCPTLAPLTGLISARIPS